MKDPIKKCLKVFRLYEISRLVWVQYLGFIYEIRLYLTHLKGCRKARRIISSSKRVKLELGGGAKGKDGWINVDIHPAAELCLDLRRPLPFPDGSIDAIYSEHVLEHFSQPELSMLLSECFRVMKTGGKFFVSVPDFGKAVSLYVQSDEGRLHGGKFWASPNPDWCRNNMDELDWLLYMGGVHKFMFDGQNLVSRLLEAGFIKAGLREFDPSLDSENRKHQSLYAVAVK